LDLFIFYFVVDRVCVCVLPDLCVCVCVCVCVLCMCVCVYLDALIRVRDHVLNPKPYTGCVMMS
jgi:hypothetical protein